MKKKIIKKPTFTHHLLPTKLIVKVESDIFSNPIYSRMATKNNLLKCIAIIYHYQIDNYISYVPLGSSYWKRVFGGNYYEKVISPLLDAQILEMFDFGYRNTGNKDEKGKVGKRYRINPELLNDDFRLIYYISSRNDSRKDDDKHQKNEPKYILQRKKLNIDILRERALEYVDKHLEQICRDEYLQLDIVNHFPGNFIIEYNEQITVDGHTSFDKRYSTVAKAQLRADLNGKELFFFKNTFYIADLDQFLQERIMMMQHHYGREVARINSNCFTLGENRNPKTLRIYNDLSNFPSHLLQFIKINNKTTHSIDLRSSQLLLFANLLNVYLLHLESSRLSVDAYTPQKHILGLFHHLQTQNHLKRLFQALQKHDLPQTGIEIHEPPPSIFVDERHDVLRFISDVFHNDFYNVIKNKLNLPSRAVAKQLIFKLFFSKGLKSDVFLDKLAEEYPTIMSIIADFKNVDNKKKSKNSIEGNLSVFLQNVESEIYIDRILLPLRELGIGCFSRHDSLIVEDGKQDIAQQHIKKVFDEDLGFLYGGTTEDKYFDVYDDTEILDELDDLL